MLITSIDFGRTLRKLIILSIFMIAGYTIGTKILSRRSSSLIFAMATIKDGVTEKAYVSGTFSVAFVTTPNETVAKNLARKLVEEKLAACVNIVPGLTSVYEWQGKINEDSESMMVIKTRSSLIDDLSSFVRQNHPYEVAEVITLPITGGNAPYLKWLGQTIKNVPA